MCRAKVCSQLGIVDTGTNALDANVRGKSQINPPDCAASTLRTNSPIKAEIQEKAKLTPSRTRMPSRNSSGVPPGRKPTRNPTASMMATVNRLRARSAMVRPVRTADDDIGSDRKRSIRPRCMSWASPMAVVTPPKATVCTKIPGIRKLTYWPPGTWIAPPKT